MQGEGAHRVPGDISSLNERKLGHIRACLDASVDLQRDSFAGHKLKYNALPEIDLDEVTTECEFANRIISAPLIISSMTGGVGQEFRDLNTRLAEAAEALRIPLGLGSMKVLLKHKEARASYDIRDVAPSAPIIANLGLVSFNYGLSYADVEHLVDMLRPDVFGFHLNALQEAVQDEGDTNFTGLLKKLEEIVRRCPLPVYVKECGGGIAPDLVQRLADIGVHYIDVSGNDGTSWSAVESRLSADSSLGEAFKDFGLPTAWILERVNCGRMGRTRLVASGGIRNGIQAVKALALGARYASVARPFLLAATDSTEQVIRMGERFIREIRTAMFLTGVKSLDRLDRTALLTS